MDSSTMESFSSHHHHYHLPQRPQSPHRSLSLQDNGQPIEALYAQVNKPRNGFPAAPDSQMTPSNHDRIRRLKHEFQQTKQEEDLEDHRHTYSFDQSWAANGTEIQSGRHSAAVETQVQKHNQDNREGVQQTQRTYNSLPRQPRKNLSTLSQDSWDKVYVSQGSFQATKDNTRYSSSQGSRNGYLGASSLNARVLLETQELLRQEQRRREQEANKSRPLPQEPVSGNTYDQHRDRLRPKGLARAMPKPQPRAHTDKMYLHLLLSWRSSAGFRARRKGGHFSPETFISD